MRFAFLFFSPSQPGHPAARLRLAQRGVSGPQNSRLHAAGAIARRVLYPSSRLWCASQYLLAGHRRDLYGRCDADAGTLGAAHRGVPAGRTEPDHHQCPPHQSGPGELIPCLSGSIPELPHVEKLKNGVEAKFATDPSRPVFGNRVPCSRATKRAGWKSAWTCGPSHNFSMSAPAPLKKMDSSQERTFSTESAMCGRLRVGKEKMRPSLTFAT